MRRARTHVGRILIWALFPYVGNAVQLYLSRFLVTTLALSVGSGKERFFWFLRRFLPWCFLLKKSLPLVLRLVVYRGSEKVVWKFFDRARKSVPVDVEEYLLEFPVISRLAVVAAGFVVGFSEARLYQPPLLTGGVGPFVVIPTV